MLTQPIDFNPESQDGTDPSDQGSEPQAAWGRLVAMSKHPCMHDTMIELVEDEVSFGRGNNNDYVFNDPVISGKHCVIRREQSGSASNEWLVWVEDLSTNKTYINHEPIGKGQKKLLTHSTTLDLIWKGKGKDEMNISYLFQDSRHEIIESHEEGGPHEKYLLKEVLGTGNFATVKLAIQKETGMRYAVKIIDKKKFMMSNATKRKNALLDEVKILQRLSHPNIIKIFEVFETTTTLYLILELVTGGELFNKIIDSEKFPEPQARRYFIQMLQATKYLHEQGIAHRDLKPENILLSDADTEVIKLSDFGLSRMVDNASYMKTVCGTPQYVAPEILTSAQGGVGYGLACDLWSLGVILYVMLVGYPPFNESRDKSVFQQIKDGDFDFPDEFWSEISESVKDLIRKLLEVEPKKRFTVDQALEDPWVKIPILDKPIALAIEASPHQGTDLTTSGKRKRDDFDNGDDEHKSKKQKLDE